MSQTVTEFEACKEDVSNRLGGLQAAKIQILDKLCDRPTVGLDSETIRGYYIRPLKHIFVVSLLFSTSVYLTE